MMPGVNSSVNSASSRKYLPPQTCRLRPYAMPIVTARLSSVPITVMPRLTVMARVTTPPAKIVRYAFKGGCSGQITRPPFLMTSGPLARLVASTLRNGYTTAKMTTAKTPILTARSSMFSRSSQAGRSTAPDSITSGPFPGPSPLAQRTSSRHCTADGRSRVDPFLAHPVREFVGSDHQGGADDALDQTRGGGDAPLTADDALEIHVGVQHLTRRRAYRVALQQDLLEAHRQDQPEPQDQQQHRHAQDAWQGDAPQPLPPSRPVDNRCLVQGGVDVQQRRQIDDGGVAGLLPDQLGGDQRLEQGWLGHDIDRRQPEIAQGMNEDARAAKYLLPQRDHDHPRDEVGQVDDALNNAPHLGADDAVQHQRQADRSREVEDDLQQGDDDRVRGGLPERLVAQHRLEVGKPDEWTFGKAEEWQVVLERDDVAEQRQIAEQDEVQD